MAKLIPFSLIIMIVFPVFVYAREDSLSQKSLETDSTINFKLESEVSEPRVQFRTESFTTRPEESIRPEQFFDFFRKVFSTDFATGTPPTGSRPTEIKLDAKEGLEFFKFAIEIMKDILNLFSKIIEGLSRFRK